MELLALADGTLVWPARIRPWFGNKSEVKNLDLNFAYGRDKRSLLVTVDGALEDDLHTADLVPFLLQQGVIDGKWVIAKANDTDGCTHIDDTYTTFALERR